MNVERGRPDLLGAQIDRDGVNFCVYSRHANVVELLLFDRPDAAEPSCTIILNPEHHRTDSYWHAWVQGVGHGQIYAYRCHGPYAPDHGHRFDAAKILIDPYSRAVHTPPGYDRNALKQPGGPIDIAMKSAVLDPTRYDWEGDKPVRCPPGKTIVYEMHVRGFTAHESSGLEPARRGTYAGLIDKIDYLKDLGITTVELLPVHQFDVQETPSKLTNYWGYTTVSFFSPHAQFSIARDPLAAADEFRDMIKALHRAGIEVILDVVYNHTAEGNETGPTFCYRGFENTAYYILEKDRSKYSNFTGCGNTINASHSVVRRMVLDSLRYWVQHMHVDGFRFDLAPIFARDHKGRVMKDPPIVWEMATDPALAGVKLIAEPWDCAGLNQVGHFGGHRWSEWNDHFRNDVRKFVRGDGGAIRGLASRILGSPDLFERDGRCAENSINYVTCHDGFTLNDLYSYGSKHNEANLEDNRDGTEDNLGTNCGAEGPTEDASVNALRDRLCKNAMAILMVSLGTPMINMGDEVRRTQNGNNNGYCQDNELSWFDWRLVEQNRVFHEFVKSLIRLRLESSPVVREHRTLAERLRHAKIRWHSTKLRQADWADHSRCVSVTITTAGGDEVYHLIFNGSEYDLDFDTPRPPKPRNAWLRLLDT
ncbi:MAG TPA: glycogen debranching protein GlgX, partial [Tepidisphaeraceae bacterium]|nr:glycogen debranching protein GlgX [Tepidisphaeraceae bacterium]